MSNNHVFHIDPMRGCQNGGTLEDFQTNGKACTFKCP